VNTYLGLTVLSFLLAALLTPLVARLAVAIHAVDEPGGRRIHSGSIPRLGGVAIFIAFVLPQIVIPFLGNRVSRRFLAEWPMVRTLLGSALVVLLLGVLDDLKPRRPWFKLLVLLAAGGALCSGGFLVERISLPFGGTADISWLAWPLTLAWLVGIANAINLLDGVDGAAAGISAIVAFSVAFSSGPEASPLVWVAASCLIGASLGFLLHNFSPAKVFMGDSGALFLGFVIAALAIPATQKRTAAITMFVPIAALALPIFDTGAAILRRLSSGRPIMSGDRRHVHHRLLALGYGQRTVALALYGVSGLTGLGAVALAYSGRIGGLVVAAFFLFFFFAIMVRVGILDGRAGITALRERIRRSARNRAIRDVELRARDGIAHAESAPAIWEIVRSAADQLQVRQLGLTLESHEPGQDETTTSEWRRPNAAGEPGDEWKIVLPVRVGDSEFGRLRVEPDSSDPEVIGQLAAAFGRIAGDMAKRVKEISAKRLPDTGKPDSGRQK